MNNLQLFNSEQFGTIRTLAVDGEPWFVAADVCKALEIQNVTQALDRLDDDERSMFNIGRQGETNVVNEPGLYTLILGSRKPEAKAFKRWITHEVLPAIRKTGMYSTGSVTKAMTELHAAMTAMRGMLDDLEDRFPRKPCALNRALDANARGELTPRHFYGYSNKARHLLNPEAIRNRIRVTLIEDDISVKEFARDVGVDKRSVYRWLSGEYLPDGRVFDGLVARLRCDITDLLR